MRDHTLHYPPDPFDYVQPRGVQELLEGIQKEVYPELSEEELRELIYGPLDLTKVRLTPGTLANVLPKHKHKGKSSGNKHYNTRRLKRRLRAASDFAYQEPFQKDYRESLWGRYKYRVKKNSHKGIEYNISFEEFRQMHLNLGTEPESKEPYWKLLGSRKQDSLQMFRIDTKKPWSVDNVEFKYKEVHVAFGRDLIDLEHVNEPSTDGTEGAGRD